MLQRVRWRWIVGLFSFEVSGNADVLSPLSQEKENLGALERKYADLTGGRSFTLREVGFSSGRPLSFDAPQDSEGGGGCGTFLKEIKMGGLSPSSASTRKLPHWPTSVGSPAVAGVTRPLLTRSACALCRPSSPLFFPRRPR